MARPTGGHEQDLVRKNTATDTAQRIFKANPKLSLKKLTEEIRKENGMACSYATMAPIYRKLREEM
jgi:hypothetical protein